MHGTHWRFHIKTQIKIILKIWESSGIADKIHNSMAQAKKTRLKNNTKMHRKLEINGWDTLIKSSTVAGTLELLYMDILSHY